MPKKKFNPFKNARTEVGFPRHTHSPQTQSKAYPLAFTDQDFLLREELRPVRLQLELLKAELMQQDQNIDSTIVVYGSARISEKSVAEKKLAAAREALQQKPGDKMLQMKVNAAENLVKSSRYYDEARKFSEIVSKANQDQDEHEFVVVTGGGPGIMEAANRGAYDVKAKTIGLNIVLPMEQGPNPYVSPDLCFQFHYFAIRKMHFLIRAKAIVVFPGGYGTLDELFESLTLMQTGKIQPIPVFLFGREFWEKLINFDLLIQEGVVSPEDIQLFRFVETAEETWQRLQEFYKQYGVPK